MRNDSGLWRGEYFELNAPEWLLSDNAFLRLSSLNKGVRMERTADGRLIAMPPVSMRVSMLNAHLTARLGQWDEATGLGVGFASSIGFHLPNGAVLSPDLSWVSQERWDALPKKERERFPPLSPDFVGEIVGPPLTLDELQAKMREWIENGSRLGWLIDPKSKRVEIYRQGQDVEVLDNPPTLSGEDVLPGFVLDFNAVLRDQ